MKKFYVKLHTPKDRCGCRWSQYKVIEADTKTAIRKRYKGTGYGIEYIYTEDEVNNHPYGESIKSKF